MFETRTSRFTLPLTDSTWQWNLSVGPERNVWVVHQICTSTLIHLVWLRDTYGLDSFWGRNPFPASHSRSKSIASLTLSSLKLKVVAVCLIVYVKGMFYIDDWKMYFTVQVHEVYCLTGGFMCFNSKVWNLYRGCTAWCSFTLVGHFGIHETTDHSVSYRSV
jgi:hypothetical protein